MEAAELRGAVQEALRLEFRGLEARLSEALRAELRSELRSPSAPSEPRGPGASGSNLELRHMPRGHTVSELGAGNPKHNFMPLRSWRGAEYRKMMEAGGAEYFGGSSGSLPSMPGLMGHRPGAVPVSVPWTTGSWVSEAGSSSPVKVQVQLASDLSSEHQGIGALPEALPGEVLPAREAAAAASISEEPSRGTSQTDKRSHRTLAAAQRVHRAAGLTPANHRGATHLDLSALQQSRTWRRLVFDVVKSPCFELLTMLMITASAVHIGLQTDHVMRHRLVRPALGFRVVDILLLVWFSLEVVLRLFTFRRHYFTMWGWGWNVLDLVLVSIQLIEEVALLSTPDDESVSPALGTSIVLRACRVLRVVRVFRAFHFLRATEELRLLTACIGTTFRQFFWSTCLISLIIYVFAVHLTQAVHVVRLESPEREGPWIKYYEDVPTTFVSLFQGLTGGCDWYVLADPLFQNVSPWVGWLFVAYTAFMIFAVLNVVTGTFVQHAIERASQVKDMNKIGHAARLFSRLDPNQSGSITLEEIERNLQTAEVIDFFESIDVDPAEAKLLFDLYDFTGDGSIDFNDFLLGCLRLQGPSKVIDLVMIMRELKDAQHQERH